MSSAVARVERLRIGIADARHAVPVAPAGRDVRQRRAGGDPEQAPLRVELVEQPVEVVLVGAPAVVEDERALGLARRLAEQMDELVAHEPACARSAG